ncbi:MAG: PQQ-binding-like beta-propeller repeat protein [Rhodothermales bacterium]
MIRFSVLILCAAGLLSACASPEPGPTDPINQFLTWTRYEGGPHATSFSMHDQIDRSNVDRLEVAWTFSDDGVSDINPIVVDSFMYVIAGDGEIAALHAATGRELWRHRSEADGGIRTHGLMYWGSADRSDRRVLSFKGTYHLIAVDAVAGDAVTSFGDDGIVDLRSGLGVEPSMVTSTTNATPGVVWEDLVVLGSAPGEGYVASPGHIRAFNVRTGEQEWIFHTLPQPGEFGYDTWPEGRSDNDNPRAGGANSWGGMSVDYERGIVYVPLGSANYDFYGVDRHGENLFANSLVALDARTGEHLWHFQTIHHDLWDYDLTATPVLLTVEHEGEMKDIVAQATKTGMVFVFDRVTGEPLWPIEERPVPESDMPGEQAWPTQPFSTHPEPFIPQSFDLETDLNPYLEASERDSIVEAVRGMLYKGIYTPPDTQPTLQVPGNRGGANFGSTAGDPRDGTFYVLSYNMPSVLDLQPITTGATGTGASPIDRGQGVYQQYCQICHGGNLEGNVTSGIASLRGVTNRLSHGQLENVIRGGRGQMPPFPQLSQAEYNDLQMFLTNPDLALTEGASQQEQEDPTRLPNPETRYQSGWVHILDSKGRPLAKPPWFRLTAYDLNDGSIKWQAPIGDDPELAAQGIDDTGSAAWLRGGPAVTAGGLIFQITGTKLRAYDSETGEELWAGDLPALGDNIPAVYQVNGRQFVVASAPGPRQYIPSNEDAPQTPGYVAFSLPVETP